MSNDPTPTPTAEDKLAAALASLVEADTKAENERHEAALEGIRLVVQKAKEDDKAEDARHAAAIASLRERAVAKLLAAAESIPAADPAAPKAERSKRTRAQMEADGNAVIAKMSATCGDSPTAIAKATGLDVSIVRPTLRALVAAGRVIKIGEGKGVTYSLPTPAASPAVNGGA